MKLGRFLAYAGVVVAIASAAAWALAPRPVRVELQPVRIDRFEQLVREEAAARVSDRFVVSTPVSGLLERPWLRVGDPVAPGAIVALMRPAPPAIRDARTVAELRERAAATEAALLRARANVELARTALERAQSDHQRIRELASRGYVTASAEEQARNLVTQQAQSLKAAEFGAQAAQHELLQAQAAVREGQWTGGPPKASQLEIRTERAGTVLKILRDSEAVVAAGTPVFELGDVSVLEIVAEVLSQDATAIRPGMPVRM
ncbi:MAG TPA: HlyD family efflux transporter periplasmic adaptor subunit, partial [Burkholderiaceae bacterium]|nr:HlyD family efflux transporter periplasmic adaptor subunit [Burkholderiaceae bacterium]